MPSVFFLLQVAQIKTSVTILCRYLEGCSIVYFNHIIMLSPNFHLRRGAHVDAPDVCEACVSPVPMQTKYVAKQSLIST